MRLTAINFYPVKSCRGLALDEARLDARGIVHDRSFMVVDVEGRFMTQREYPRLCLIATRLDGDLLCFSAEGTSALQVPVQRDGARCSVIVWRDACLAVDQGVEAARWLTEFLGTSARLVRMADDYVRQVDQAYAPRVADQTGFADAFPLLLLSTASLTDLNSRLEQPLPMNRFRPNLVISGCEPYAEDGWRRIRIGALEFHVVKPCSRCAITTTDQVSAVRDKEPLRTLATYRKRGTEVFFGQNVIHAGPGFVRVGDPVEILE
jgi:uncharacterized protein